MCGIAGIISKNPTMVQHNRLQLMGNALQHRGPDGEGFWINPTHTVGFAHRRLAVIDLSAAAAQPMHYKNRYSIVFNGEIYNYIELREDLKKKGYHFTTESDTEVLLALYDCYNDDFLQYLDGMFALAIWDEQYKELLIARDRFGEKPLYYFFDGEKLMFASEMKALWAAGVPKEVNNNMLFNYLSAGFVSNPNNATETFYNNIKKLPAAHGLCYSTASNEIFTYQHWLINKATKPFPLSEKSAVEIFAEKFNQSVQLRLRSDVPVGTSLSGGLDSSSIVATIAQLNTNNLQPKTFSAIFPGFEKDESKYINPVNQQFNLQSHTITPTAQDFVNDFDKLLYHQEEPFQSSSIYAQYKVYELAKQHGVTVLLDGQGADETLGGYTKYYHWYWQQLVSSFQFSKLSKEKNAALANGNTIEWSFKNYAAAFLPSMAAKKLQQQLIHSVQQNTLLTKDFIEAGFDKNTFEKPVIKSLNDILYYNTFQNGLEDLLRYADRNSMAHGREVRLPFLSHELVEYIFKFPADYKIQNGFTKHLLRLAMNNYLPKEIVWRKDKVGFEPPQQQWMQHKQMQEQIIEAKKKLISQGILDKQSLEQKQTAQSAHEANNFDWWFLCGGSLM
jgi:asparagine synthase (glutamine-hydrolysing)